MKLKDFMEKYMFITASGYMIMRPRCVCNDGYSISIQASNYHYCEPRKSLLTFDYQSVELGFPSEADSMINEYAEDQRDYERTVYPYVPVEVVEQLLQKHGGIKGPDEKFMKHYESLGIDPFTR